MLPTFIFISPGALIVFVWWAELYKFWPPWLVDEENFEIRMAKKPPQY